MLLIVIGCMLFCATDVIKGEGEYIDISTDDTTGDTSTDGNGSTDNQTVVGDGSAVSESGANAGNNEFDGNESKSSDPLTAADSTLGTKGSTTATLDLAGGNNSTTKNGSSTSAANVAKVPQTFTLDLSGGSAGEESTTSAANDLSESAGEDSTTTNDQAKPLTFAEIQANLVAQYEKFLPEGKTWNTATEVEKTEAILESREAMLESTEAMLESMLPEGKNLETASAKEIAEAGVETMVQEAAANTTSTNPALDAFFKLSQNILDWFDTVFGKITEIFNNFDSIFNGTKTTTNEINIQNFKAQLLVERNAAPDLSPARMSDIQTSVDASSNEANNINAAKKVLGITNSEFTAEDVENAYSDTSLKKAAVNQILDGTQSINIATNIKNAYKVLLNNIPTANLNL